MKSISILICILSMSAFYTIEQTIKMKITVTNIQPNKGSIVVNIYNKEENFFKKTFVTQTQKANNSSILFEIEIPKGIYAISVFQDLDEDGKLKQGLFGIPKEPVGFGNNYKPSFSAPSFSDCSINLSNENATFNIKLSK